MASTACVFQVDRFAGRALPDAAVSIWVRKIAISKLAW
jgi:hypothetical protein